MPYTLEQLQKMGAQPVTPTPAIKTAVNSAVPPAQKKGIGYTFEQLQQMGAKPVETTTPIAAPAPKEKGFLKKVGEFFTGNTQALANTLGTAMSATGANKLQDEVTTRQSALDDAVRRKMGDPNVLPEQKKRLLEMSQRNRPDQIIDSNETFQKTNKQVFGEALGTVGEIASFGTIGTGAKAVKGGFAAKQTIGQMAKMGAKEGAKAGAIFGGARGISDSARANESFGEIAKKGAFGTVIGAGAGAVLGAAIPAAIGGISNKMGARAAKNADMAAWIDTGTPDARIATKTLTPGGKIVTDKVAKKVVRQGVSDADVALIKMGSATDKNKMLKMIAIREGQATNKRLTVRATDVVGDTFLEKIAKPLAQKNREAGSQLEIVARKLAGKKVDSISAIISLSDDLEKAGIKINSKGKLNFKGSDFEGITTAQRAIKNVWNRAVSVAKSGDAMQLHRAKRYVDEVVDYGKAAEGLSGKAQRILKSFRHNADGVLDMNFPEYNAVNTTFAETIGELNKINQAMGRTFKIGDSFADARAGVTMRRILSNTQSRSDLLQMLESSQKVASKYGIKMDEDIITQANFADLLEKTMGSEAPTSFLGQIERGVGNTEKAVSALGEVFTGHPIRGALQGIGSVKDFTLGLSKENQIKALKELLMEKSSRSVFVKPKIPPVLGKKSP